MLEFKLNDVNKKGPSKQPCNGETGVHIQWDVVCDASGWTYPLNYWEGQSGSK